MTKLESLLKIIDLLGDEKVPTVDKPHIKYTGEDFMLGEVILIRTVTMIQVGKVCDLSPNFVWLEDASWIADTGRFTDSLKEGIENQEKSEIELFVNPVRVGIGAIIEVVSYSHPLPTKQK